MRSIPLVLAAVLVLAVGTTSAQAPPSATAPADSGAVLETAVVRAPGPGMWKVQRGDHTLWILGTVSPLPAGMVWNSARMRRTVASADAVLYGPMVVVGTDVGFFGKLALLPSLVGIRELPDDRRLSDVLPPATYARWASLKRRYIGNDAAVEQWRPIFAAGKLYEEALEQRHLSQKSVVGPALTEALKARGMKGISPAAKLTIANPKKVIKEFKGTQLADVRCFEHLLDRVENDLDMLQARAQAWASGDIATLRALDRGEPGEDCEDALLSGAFAKKYGLDTLRAQARTKWIAEAEASLAKNRVTFSTLQMHEVLSPRGVVAALAAKGYVVEAPSDVSAP
ncbi:TraB/GumN family protein [Lysobacter xanthus]